MKTRKKLFNRLIAAWAVWVLLSSVFFADRDYELVGSRVYKVKNIYQITNHGKYKAFDIHINVLLMSDGSSSYQKNLSYQTVPALKATHEDSFGNIYGELLLSSLNPGESKTITIEKTIENSGISYEGSINTLNPSYDAFKKRDANLAYLGPSNKIEVDAAEMIKKAAAFDSDKKVMQKARAIYDFVNLYMKYDENPTYANHGALSALKTGRGVCFEYATLFTALCRAQKIPARTVTGYWVDGALKPNQWTDIAPKGHAWAEFYLPSQGWIPAEPSYFYTYNGKRIPNHDYFANIPIDSRHFISGYTTNQEKGAIDITYSCYNKTEVAVKNLKQALMLVGDHEKLP